MDFTQLINDLIQFGIKAVIALVLLAVGWVAIGKISKKVASGAKLQKHDPTVASFIQSAISLGGKIFLVIICVMIVGVPGATFAALIASAGVTIGLAMQGGLSNLAGGLMLLIFRPFSVGDYISSEGMEGTVTGINIFYTTIRTVDNRKIFLPNGGLSNAALVNVTAEETRRVEAVYTVTFDSDVEKAKKVLKLIANADSRVLKDPEPAVVITKYSDGAYQMSLRAWCKTSDYWDVYFSIQDKVQPAFEASGIKLGYPHLNVHVDQQ